MSKRRARLGLVKRRGEYIHRRTSRRTLTATRTRTPLAPHRRRFNSLADLRRAADGTALAHPQTQAETVIVDMRTTTDDQSIDHEIGEAQLFWACWTAELPHFKKLCGRWLCASPQDVDDVLSLGALKALAYLRHHPGEVRRFRPWAQRLLHNLCVDLLRAQRRVIELVDDDPTSQAAGPVTSDPPQTRDLSRRELGRALDRALITLPPRLRDVFDLRFREELTYPEIAQRLQITQENARKRVQQAREQLRRQLLEHAH